MISRDIVQSLISGKIREFTESLCIYYYLETTLNRIKNEAEFESSLVSLFSGFQDAGNCLINQQQITGDGRCEIIIQCKEGEFIIELKYNKTSKEAYDQILEKCYGKDIHGYINRKYLIGINFNDKLQTIDALSYELRTSTENVAEHFKVAITNKNVIPEAEITIE